MKTRTDWDMCSLVSERSLELHSIMNRGSLQSRRALIMLNVTTILRTHSAIVFQIAVDSLDFTSIVISCK